MREQSNRLTVAGAAAMLETIGNGQCHAWAEFMHELLKAQGLSSVNGAPNRRIRLDVTQGKIAFAIKNWQRQSSTNEYLIINFDAGVDGTFTINLSAGQAADILGVSGQGNSPNPPSRFGNHFIIKVGNSYYDPSYGMGPFAYLKEYEDSAFSGYITGYPLLSGGYKYYLLDMPFTLINQYQEFTF